MPKPPPTFSEITRNLVSGTLKISLAMNAADRVRPLHGAAQRVAILARIVFGEAAARLHRIGGEPADRHAMAHDVSGARRRPSSTAALSPASWTKAWLSGHSSHTAGAPGATASSERHHGRQRLVVDLDRLGGVLRLVERVGDHERHRIADVAHALVRRAAAAGARRPASRRAACAASSGAAGRAPGPRDRRRSARGARRASSRASAASIARMRACACGERST